MTNKPPEIELATIVLQWNLKTDLGQRAQSLAREILGEKDHDGEVEKGFLRAQILETETNVPRLEDLKKSLLSMDAEELRAKIREIREDRVIRKDSKATKVKRTKTKATAQSKLAELLAGMSPSEVAAFMKEIEG